MFGEMYIGCIVVFLFIKIANQKTIFTLGSVFVQFPEEGGIQLQLSVGKPPSSLFSWVFADCRLQSFHSLKLDFPYTGKISGKQLKRKWGFSKQNTFSHLYSLWCFVHGRHIYKNIFHLASHMDPKVFTSDESYNDDRVIFNLRIGQNSESILEPSLSRSKAISLVTQIANKVTRYYNIVRLIQQGDPSVTLSVDYGRSVLGLVWVSSGCLLKITVKLFLYLCLLLFLDQLQ